MLFKILYYFLEFSQHFHIFDIFQSSSADSFFFYREKFLLDTPALFEKKTIGIVPEFYRSKSSLTPRRTGYS